MRKLWLAICAANLFVAPWPRNVLADIYSPPSVWERNRFWLVVSNMNFIFHIHGKILPIDFHILPRGWNHQPRFFVICLGRPIPLPLPGMAERDACGADGVGPVFSLISAPKSPPWASGENETSIGDGPKTPGEIQLQYPVNFQTRTLHKKRWTKQEKNQRSMRKNNEKTRSGHMYPPKSKPHHLADVFRFFYTISLLRH